jgi:hypothetical protein
MSNGIIKAWATRSSSQDLRLGDEQKARSAGAKGWVECLVTTAGRPRDAAIEYFYPTGYEGAVVLSGCLHHYFFPRQPELYRGVYGHVPIVEERSLAEIKCIHADITAEARRRPGSLLDMRGDYMKSPESFIEKHCERVTKGSCVYFESSQFHFLSAPKETQVALFMWRSSTQ